MNETHERIVKAAAGGNPLAEDFLRAFIRRAHFVDDLADKGGFTAQEIASAEADWMLTITSPFFLSNRAALLPLMALSLNAWVDSHLFDDVGQRSVLEGMWHEVVFCVALITGGWSRLRGTTGAYRDYEMEGTAVPIAGAEEKQPDSMTYGPVR